MPDILRKRNYESNLDKVEMEWDNDHKTYICMYTSSNEKWKSQSGNNILFIQSISCMC